MPPARTIDILCCGLLTIDHFSYVDHFPARNGKTVAPASAIEIGGPATGAARIAAHLGSRTALLTSLGTHPLAPLARDRCASSSLELFEAHDDAAAPLRFAQVIVHRPSGDRSVLLDPLPPTTAYPALNEDTGDLIERALDLLPKVIILDGYQDALSVRLAQGAQRKGIPILLDGGSWKPVLAEILPAVRWAALSADFRLPGRSETTGAELAAALGAYGVEHTIITRGDQPVEIYDAHDAASPTRTIDVPKVQVVDTLGAGDAFHGALAHYLACDFGLDEAVRAAVALASRTVTWHGLLPQ